MEKVHVHVRRWDAATGKEEPRARERGELVDWVAFAADGRRYLTGGGNNFAYLRRPDSDPGEKALQRFPGSHAVAGGLSADGRRVIIGLNDLSDRTSVRVYDADSADRLAEYRGHREAPRCVALSDDGRWAFSASPDHHAAWEVKAETENPRLARGKNTIRCAVFVPKSGRVVFGYATGTVSMFDSAGAADVEAFSDPPRDAVTCLAASPDGRVIVVGAKDMALRAWDLATKRLKWEVSGLAEEPVAAAFSSDGTRLVTATARSWAVWTLPR
jgi:WD40 repeat protein